ncbi:MAG TPA: hypothetical protein VOA80_08575 [Thermoanaerobaculia bacterium]|nr:hypothetical protein [Thermoanaerobaculia bacterium]
MPADDVSWWMRDRLPGMHLAGHAFPTPEGAHGSDEDRMAPDDWMALTRTGWR